VRAPELGHGPQDQRRFGDDDEQGLEVIEAHWLFGASRTRSRS
jgi:hypothetical protein